MSSARTRDPLGATQKVEGSRPHEHWALEDRRVNFRAYDQFVTRSLRSSSGRDQRKNPLTERAYPKRLMGLEPTTFCMASSA
jgi:hypothetical protein